MLFKVLLFSAALEAGFLNGSTFNYNDRNIDWLYFGALYTSLDAKVTLGPAYLGGGMICYFTPDGVLNFSPFQMTYLFNLGLNFGNVQLEFEHSCYHPEQPYATIFGTEIKPKYEGGYNRIFVRIRTKE